jgi:hypothetical protein
MPELPQYRVHPDDPRRVVMLWYDPQGDRWWADPYSADNFTDDEVKNWERLTPVTERGRR